MFPAGNPEDQAIQEADRQKQEQDLEREYHMCEIRKLARRHYGLKQTAMEMRVIKSMTREIEMMKPSIETMYCRQYTVRDNYTKGYLVYLLQMKDYYSAEVSTKKVMIKQRKDQISAANRRLDQMMADYAKRVKVKRHRVADYIKIDSYSKRIELAQKKLGALRKENNDIKDNIKNAGRSRRQFLKYADEFQKRIKAMKDAAVKHLEAAVICYRHREDHMSKAKVIQERCDMDLQKAQLNENLLHLSNSKIARDKRYGALQRKQRVDTRVQSADYLMRSGRTGLEPNIRIAEQFRDRIMAASGTPDLNTLRMRFKEREDEAFSVFAYLEEMEAEIKFEQSAVEELRRSHRDAEAAMGREGRLTREDIKDTMEKGAATSQEAEALERKRDAAGAELEDLFTKMASLYRKCGVEDESLTEAVDTLGVLDSNVADFLSTIECRVVELAMVLEYVTMKSRDSEKPFAEEDEPLPLILDSLLPDIELRSVSEADPQIQRELEQASDFWTIDELMVKASAAVAASPRPRVSSSDDEGSTPTV